MKIVGADPVQISSKRPSLVLLETDKSYFYEVLLSQVHFIFSTADLVKTKIRNILASKRVMKRTKMLTADVSIHLEHAVVSYDFCSKCPREANNPRLPHFGATAHLAN